MDLNIDAFEDRKPIHCVLDNSPFINLTGEGGSGKSTYSQQYKDNPEYIVVDYDLILLGTVFENDIEYFLRKQIVDKYGESIFRFEDLEDARKKFTVIYEEIINLLESCGKKILLDGTQLRFIDDVKKIKGELIVLRPSVETCIARSVERKQSEHPEFSKEELMEYEQKRREILYSLNPLLNELINKVSDYAKFEEFTIDSSNRGITR